MTRTEILSWDWKGQPDLVWLARIIADLSGSAVHLAEVVTGSDEYAIVLSDEVLGAGIPAEVYRRTWEGA